VNGEQKNIVKSKREREREREEINNIIRGEESSRRKNTQTMNDIII